MSKANRWLLPAGVDELLPPEAWAAEHLRRSLLDHYHSAGYELVSTPLVEFLESLLTGTGNELSLQTFKVTDQLTGRSMGVRSDITPQVARIDAHVLQSEQVSRLCYADAVLHTRPAHPMTTRCPYQIGCELFGVQSLAADIEVISLMLDSLNVAGIDQLHVDLAHVGIYKGLLEGAELGLELQEQVFDAFGRKSIPELDALVEQVPELAKASIALLRAVAGLSGGVDALVELKQKIEGLEGEGKQSVAQAIEELEQIQQAISARYPNVELGIDFSELRGYNYHTGVMFSAYTPSHGYALAKGGRYDDIGKDFGRSRAATGFSADLKNIVRLGTYSERNIESIVAPAGSDAGLVEEIKALRAKGFRVVQRLEESDTSTYGCSKQLLEAGGAWKLESL